MRYLLPIIFLAACHTPDKNLNRRLYQPDALILPANTKVQTTEGIYQSSPDGLEIWHSEKTVEKLERELSKL